MLNIDEATMYRYTVYRVKHTPEKGKDHEHVFPIKTRLEFLEYLNDDELDSWMTVKAHKYPSIIVVRSDGKWVLYDQPHGSTYKKIDSGKNFNTAYAGRYNKKADVSETSFISFKEFLVEATKTDSAFAELIKQTESLPFDKKEKSEVLPDKSYIRGKIGKNTYTFSYMKPSSASGRGYVFTGLSVSTGSDVINKHNTTFKKMSKGVPKGDSAKNKLYTDNLKEFESAIKEVKTLSTKA